MQEAVARETVESDADAGVVAGAVAGAVVGEGEGGGCFRAAAPAPWAPPPIASWQRSCEPSADVAEETLPILTFFKERTPGATLRASLEASQVFSWRAAEDEQGQLQARDLLVHLHNMLAASASAEVSLSQVRKEVVVSLSCLGGGAFLESLLRCDAFGRGEAA